jgi:hypothetical protein
MAYEPNEEGFAYWGNEETDTTQLVLMLSEQVAELQAQIEEQGAIIDELSENVVYKGGAIKPLARRVSGRGMGKLMRMPMMRPEAMAKMGIRMGARQMLKELGVSVPYAGLIVALTFQIYEGIMREIANRAAMDAIREHERKDEEARRQIIAETLEAVEKERRELYRSVVPP